MDKRKKAVSATEESKYKGVAKGVGIGLLITVAAFFIIAAVLTYSDISEGIISPASVVITSVSALLAGFYGGKDAEKRGVVWGMATGLVYVILVFLILASGQKEMMFSLGKAAGISCSIAGGGIGGILGINTKK